MALEEKREIYISEQAPKVFLKKLSLITKGGSDLHISRNELRQQFL